MGPKTASNAPAAAEAPSSRMATCTPATANSATPVSPDAKASAAPNSSHCHRARQSDRICSKAFTRHPALR